MGTKLVPRIILLILFIRREREAGVHICWRGVPWELLIRGGPFMSKLSGCHQDMGENVLQYMVFLKKPKFKKLLSVKLLGNTGCLPNALKGGGPFRLKLSGCQQYMGENVLQYMVFKEPKYKKVC